MMVPTGPVPPKTLGLQGGVKVVWEAVRDGAVSGDGVTTALPCCVHPPG